MSLISKKVQVILSPLTIKHYEDLGYYIPRYIGSKNKLAVKRGTKIEVLTCELPRGSSAKVLVKCDECGKLSNPMPYREYSIQIENCGKNYCQKCSNRLFPKNSKYTLENIREKFIKKGYIPLFENYKNAYTKLLGMTKEGYKFYANSCLKNFEDNHKPSIFYVHNPYTIENIKLWLKLNNKPYELLSTEFKSAGKSKLKWNCHKHGEFEMIWSGMHSGKGCEKCAIELHCGENNPRYNSNLTDKERELKRSIWGENLSIWRNEVYKKDNYTCQCCGDNKGHNLNAHHLDGWDWCKEKRIDINNGITLCESCHTKFHKQYGFGANTKKQFNKWLLYIKAS